MGKKKNYRGHYCYVCSRILPNEKFSGGGHKNHICKQCSKKSPEERRELRIVNDIAEISGFGILSRNNRRKLQSYLNDQSQKIRSAARSALDECNEIMIQRKLEEEYEEMFGIDPWDDEFREQNNGEMEMSIRDFDKLDGNDQNKFLLDEEDIGDELPF